MSDDLAQKIGELDDSIRLLTAALQQQSRTLGHHGAMLGQILAAVTEREEESPLVEALRALVEVGEQNAAGIARIEGLLRSPQKGAL